MNVNPSGAGVVWDCASLGGERDPDAARGFSVTS